MSMNEAVGLMGFEIEGVAGVKEALVPSSYCLLVTEPKFKIDPVSAPQTPIAPAMGTIQSRPGGRQMTVSFKVGIKGSGTVGTVPAVGALFKACCLGETNAVGIATWYKPATLSIATQTTLTITLWIDGRFYTGIGMMGSFKFGGKVNEIAYLEFEFKGVYSDDADGAAPAYLLEQTHPDVLLQTYLQLLEFHNASTVSEVNAATLDLLQAAAINILLSANLNNAGVETQLGRVRFKIKRTGLPAGFANGIRASIYTNVVAVSAPVFVGVGLDDLVVTGVPVTTGVRMRVEVDGNGPDTFRWSEDDGGTWTGTLVPFAGIGVPVALGATGLSVEGAVAGHTITEYWNFNTLDAPNALLAGANSMWVNPVYIKATEEEWVDFVFAVPPTLAAGTQYHAVLNGDFTPGVNILDVVMVDSGAISTSCHFDAAWDLCAGNNNFMMHALAAPLANLVFDAITFDLANVVALRANVGNAVEGWDRAMVTNRAPTMTLEPEEELKASRDFLAEHKAATRLFAGFSVGTIVGNRILMDIPFAQINAAGDFGEREGIRTAPLTLQVNNGLPVTVGNDEFYIKFI